jgi:hypothetical protein
MAMWTTQDPHEWDLRWTGTEMMWSEGAQVARDEKGTGYSEMVSGIQVEGEKVIKEGPLVNLG